MPQPNNLRTQSGRLIVLRQELGKGGEGIVYSVQGDEKIAAKIYHPGKDAERKEKVEAIVAAQWYKSAACVAFPIDALYAGSSRFVGFTMPLVTSNKPIHALYSPTSRKTEFPNANFKFLIHTSLNIARSLANVHATGCVVGDINQSGFLISNNAIATLIDCDSFQVTVGSKKFLCTVGVPDFTPPELQGRTGPRTRTVNHDAFGLAVIIFTLLFMGRYPFAGRYLGRGDMPMERAISEFRFAYSSRKSETNMEPPPSVALLSDLPKFLADAFEVAFGPVGVTKARPTAAEWVDLLQKAESNVKQCASNRSHQYFESASSCPWCRMEAAYPGFVAFPPGWNTGATTTPVNLAQLIAAIRGLPSPGQAADLPVLMPQFQGQPSQAISMTKASWFKTYAGVIGGAFVSAFMFRLPAPIPIAGLLALAGSVVFAYRQPKQLQAIQRLLDQLTSNWRGVETRWSQLKEPQQFLDTRRDADQLISNFQNLGSEESQKLADLKARQREAQLLTFLQKFYIEHAKIKGIGTGRKVMLRSFGIETAADVQQFRLEAISGFGPTTAGAIVGWKKSLERRFVYNPNQPINPADINAVKSEIAQKKLDLERRLRQSLAQLQKITTETALQRNNLKAGAINIWNAKKQAELDQSTLEHSFLSQKVRLAVVAVTFVASVFIQGAIASGFVGKPLGQRQAIPPAQKMTATNATADKPARSAPSDPKRDSSPPVEKEMFKSIELGRDAATAQEQGSIWGSGTSTVNSAPVPSPDFRVATVSPELSKLQAPNVPPPLGPPQSIPSLPSYPPVSEAAPSSAPPNLQQEASTLTRDNIARVQSRLREFGYLERYLNGIWDGDTRRALREFKIANHLANPDQWDAAAEHVLLSKPNTQQIPSFMGGWSNAAKCSPSSLDEPPLNIDARRARSAGGICDFLNVTQNGSGWNVRARCTVGNSSWIANIKLAVVGNQLVWSSEKGTTTYYRCQ